MRSFVDLISSNINDFPSVGLPQMIYYGDHEDGHDKIMIMEMLGLNLDKMFQQADYEFSIETIRWIAKQLVGAGNKFAELVQFMTIN